MISGPISQPSQTIIERALFAYLSTRCRVTSQHKLPTKDEIVAALNRHMVVTDSLVQLLLDSRVEKGILLKYGPYYSDHEVENL